jgi:hypothetical protein
MTTFLWSIRRGSTSKAVVTAVASEICWPERISLRCCEVCNHRFGVTAVPPQI